MWIDPTTQAVFATHAAIRSALPSFSFPADMTEADIEFAGLKAVQPSEPAQHDPSKHKAVPVQPVQIDGIWVQQWELVELPPPAIPPEVPRYCGVLALKRHRLVDGQLLQLGEEEGWESGSLYAHLIAFRNALPSGALRDKLDVAIDHVMHWTLESPTVAEMCSVMSLSTAQRDALFRWAKAHEATL